jgi:uncharacterized protein (TIGR03435 family)
MIVPIRLAISLLVTATAIAQAQSLTRITVKPARSADLESRRVRILPNGDLIATSANVIELITDGYGVPANPSQRLSALPPGVYSERFDIHAKAVAGANRARISDRDVRAIFRQVLADRFHILMRTENKSMPVYALVVAGGGPKLKRSIASDCIFDTARSGCHNFLAGFGHPLNARAVDLDDLAHYIENWTDLPVVNRTSLAGVFAMSTEGWRPMRLPPPPPNGGGDVDFTHLRSLDTILGGLGLELHKEVAIVPIYTVERIRRP